MRERQTELDRAIVSSAGNKEKEVGLLHAYEYLVLHTSIHSLDFICLVLQIR